MRWKKAMEFLPIPRQEVFIKIEGTKSTGWYSEHHEMFLNDSNDFFPPDQIEWLDEDEQDEGWMPVGSGVLPKANQKCFLYNGGLFLNFFKFWPKGFNGNDEPVFVDMNDKGTYSLDEITHWRPANIAHPDLPPATT